MPEGGDCQGLVVNFPIGLFLEKTIAYEINRSKCFKFLMK